MGGTIVGADLFLSGCTNPGEAEKIGLNFSGDTIAFLNDIGDTILPETSTSPGAKAVDIGEFMKTMLIDCYSEKDRIAFMEGMNDINETSRMRFGETFIKLKADARYVILDEIDKLAKQYEKMRSDRDSVHYFTMAKQLTLLGYFTSEIGCTKALRYVPVPGRYDGCVPYQKGERAWAL